jgi:hypothetical protein
MAPVFTEQYQLGHGGCLCFECDLTTLTLFLNCLYLEFKGAVLNEHPDGELRGLSGPVAVARREI